MTRLDRKDLIERAARQLLRSVGPSGFNIDEVTKLAGTGKGTLYLYYKSKDEILKYIVSSNLNELSAKIRHAKTLSPDSPIENLRDVIASYLSYFHHMMVVEHASHDVLEDIRSYPGLQSIVYDFFSDVIDVMKETLQNGVDKGVFHVDNVDVTSVLIVSTAGNAIWELVKNHDFEAILNSYLSTFLKGILV